MQSAGAYDIPQDNSRAKYFYVFGVQGNTYEGADDVDHEQVIYINVPETETRDLSIGVYDPDVGGALDYTAHSGQKVWNTKTRFTVYGDSDKVLDSKEFGESPEYDKKFYTFGPFAKTAGKKNGSFYQFKLVATALDGENENLFSVRVRPSSAESFSDKISFRLLPNEGDEMYFYPEIPAGVSRIIAENYDLDPFGGNAWIIDTINNKKYKIADSDSGKWAQTSLDIGASKASHRIVYLVKKLIQRNANAAIRVKDDKGNVLPIYFAKGQQPVGEQQIPFVIPPMKDSKCNKFTFDATSSYDPDKQKLTYTWDFGDGTTSKEPVVTHIYEKGGEYQVTLTVKDSSGLTCDSATTTQVVKVNTPPEPSFTLAQNGCVGDVITMDASATQDNTIDALTYKWNFGDGSMAEGAKATHAYTKGGTYTVRLTVNDNSNTACSLADLTKVIVINTPPQASAGSDIDLCVAPTQDLSVTLNGAKSKDADGDSLSYRWDFGDGERGSGETVTHVYKQPGVYTAKLTVDDGRQGQCSAASDTVSVRLNKRPVANAGKDITACTGSAVTFDGSGTQSQDANSLTYTWDFGDGTTQKGEKVTHVYSKGGTYKATLAVDDGRATACSVSKATVNVAVNSQPEVQLKAVNPACVNENISFDASGSRDADADALTYTWDFGDGTTQKGTSQINHRYAKGGTYTARVSVDDRKGTSCSESSEAVTVKVNTPPLANSGPNLVCCVGAQATFDGSASSDADGDTLNYSWDFGDGSTAQGAQVTHTYVKGGTYKVTLKVDDNSGTKCNTSTSSFEAVVNDSPIPKFIVK